MIIGNFTYDPIRDIYSGEIRTLSRHCPQVQFRKANKSSSKEPDYRIVEDSPLGACDLGAAWKCKQTRGNTVLLSVRLCDPVMGITANAMLLSTGDDTAELVCTPRRTKAKAE